MPRPVWSGAISFGLVTIPIKVLSATESHRIEFRQIHLEDMGRIRYRKVCDLEGKQLADHEIGKGARRAWPRSRTSCSARPSSAAPRSPSPSLHGTDASDSGCYVLIRHDVHELHDFVDLGGAELDGRWGECLG